MITYAAPEYAEPGLYPNAGRYVFIPMETDAGGTLHTVPFSFSLAVTVERGEQ
jgi:hypothetical protein